MSQQLMWRTASFGIAGLMFAALSVPSAWGASITTAASGTYDEQAVQSNTIDKSAAGSYGLAAFKGDIAAAFAVDNGGVINFDDRPATPTPPAPDNGFTVINATYGASGNKTLVVSYASLDGSSWTNGTFANATAISGSNTNSIGNQMAKNGGTGILGTYSMSFGAPLSKVGIAVLSRIVSGGDASYGFTVAVTYDDNSTASLSASINNANGTDDTFFGFQAPSGKTISGLSLGATDPGKQSSYFPRVDDIGFVVVPEPASLLLAAIAGLCVLGRAARRRSN